MNKLTLSQIKKTLTPQEYKVFERFYGLNGFDKQSTLQIGDRLGMSTAAVSTLVYRLWGKIVSDLVDDE